MTTSRKDPGVMLAEYLATRCKDKEERMTAINRIKSMDGGRETLTQARDHATQLAASNRKLGLDYNNKRNEVRHNTEVSSYKKSMREQRLLKQITEVGKQESIYTDIAIDTAEAIDSLDAKACLDQIVKLIKQKHSS